MSSEGLNQGSRSASDARCDRRERLGLGERWSREPASDRLPVVHNPSVPTENPRALRAGFEAVGGFEPWKTQRSRIAVRFSS